MWDHHANSNEDEQMMPSTGQKIDASRSKISDWYSILSGLEQFPVYLPVLLWAVKPSPGINNLLFQPMGINLLLFIPRLEKSFPFVHGSLQTNALTFSKEELDVVFTQPSQLLTTDDVHILQKQLR